MTKVRSRLAHSSIGAGMALGINQAAPGAPAVVIGGLAPVALGFTWEYGLQPLMAKVFPKWDPRPDKRELLDWIVGAAFGTALSLIL